MHRVLADNLVVDIIPASSGYAEPRGKVLSLRSVALRHSRSELEVVDVIRIVGEMAPQLVDPVSDNDVTLIFKKPNETPDARCKIGFVVRFLCRVACASASMLLKTAGNSIVDLPDYNPPQLQPVQEMTDRCTVQDCTGRSFVHGQRGEECGE
ncbi:hypothetical protein [Novosphingobium sp.]|uniref:hypothetical protein n=1 Tax=Novosphingobium sp. TaxID=1874826 RepID=UPI003BAC19E3